MNNKMKTRLFKTGPMMNQDTKIGLWFLLLWGLGLVAGVQIGMNHKEIMNVLNGRPSFFISVSCPDKGPTTTHCEEYGVLMKNMRSMDDE
ncbi:MULTISPECIES: hypothetical protein [Vibrio]|nr:MULTISPECIES: hypothetical protein [Vibrio]PMK83251.1 hypothetical protein BCT92_11505 [Vibrio sp. 10N.261.52.E5]PMM39105.1 hypothetical protein BCT58_00770 [Vibrio lentus]